MKIKNFFGKIKGFAMKVMNYFLALSGRGRKDRDLQVDLDEIKSSSWEESTYNDYLEEARKLRDSEADRSRAAEIKSQIYVGALFAAYSVLLPLVDYGFVINGIESLQDKFPKLSSLIPIAFSFLPGLIAFLTFLIIIFAFHTIRVNKSHLVDTKDLIRRSDEPRNYLIREILASIRYDREIVNRKVSYVQTIELLFVWLVFIWAFPFLLLAWGNYVG